MALPNLERYRGRHVNPTCKGAVTHWDSIAFKQMYSVENPQDASATYKQKVLDLTDATATISGYLGVSNNTATLPQIGDEITDLSFKIADVEQIPPELLDALQSGKWRVVDTNYDMKKDSAKWSFTIEAGFID